VLENISSVADMLFC